MAEICPICGEEIVIGACPGCGFELPDYSAIAAPYDLDPSNDHFGEADSVEGMFPYIDTSGIANEPEPEYDIPSIALPSIQSLNSAGKLASAGIQPAPNIKVRPAVQSIQSLQPASAPKPAAKPAAKPAVNVHAAPPVQTFQPSKNTPPIQPAQSVQSAPFVPYNAYTAASLPVRIVKGTVNFVIAHWWKFLIMAAAPSAGLLFAGFYVFMYREDRRTADILKAIMFGVLTGVMVFNRWDPFGLDVILREILDAIFSSRRRRRYY